MFHSRLEAKYAALQIVQNIDKMGNAFIEGLREIAREKGAFGNVRGEGSLVAFTLESAAIRDQMLKDMMSKGLLALGCGETHVRFRLPLITTQKEVDAALERVRASLPAGAPA